MSAAGPRHSIPLSTLLQQAGKGPRAVSAACNYALPEIQRDFRWSLHQVRSLAASVLAGFPIGSILLIDSIRAPSESRVFFRTLIRRDKSPVGVPYVLDGQQRLLALLATFRPPLPVKAKQDDEGSRKSSPEVGWLDEQFALKGLWFLDLDKWLDALVSAASKSAAGVGLEHLVCDPELVEGGIRREPSYGVTLENSRKLMASGRMLPLWMLTGASGPQRELSARVRQIQDELLGKYEAMPGLVRGAFEQLALLKQTSISVTRLPTCSAARAASIFRRLNRQGTALSGPDLVCSQLATFDLSLRRQMRGLIERCGNRHVPFCRAFRGMYEEDVLLVALCVRQKLSGGPWPGGIEAQLRLVSDEAGVASIRAGVELLTRAAEQDPIEAAGEVLEACGVTSRYRWPEPNISLALLAAIAVHPTTIGSHQWGLRKRELARWWWARTLASAASGRAPALPELFDELDDLMASGRWDLVVMPRSFAECNPAINLAASRRGSALPGRSLARLIECLLNRRFQRDWVRTTMDRFSSELDLHHVFPKKWVADRGLGEADVLANLILISADTNRKLIGAKGPREFFLAQTRDNPRAENQFFANLEEQGVDAEAYLGERFDDFISRRCQWFDRELAMIADGIV